MKKKLIKISKIFLVLTLIFSQLSSITTVLADEITNDDILVNHIENIEEETNALAVDGYLNYLEDESLMSLTGIKDGNSFKYTVDAKVYTQILTIVQIVKDIIIYNHYMKSSSSYSSSS